VHAVAPAARQDLYALRDVDRGPAHDQAGRAHHVDREMSRRVVDCGLLRSGLDLAFPPAQRRAPDA
jgi:hypothetical protein